MYTSPTIINAGVPAGTVVLIETASWSMLAGVLLALSGGVSFGLSLRARRCNPRFPSYRG